MPSSPIVFVPISTTQAQLEKFLAKDANVIHVPLLSDKWSESLVVLRRYMGWGAEDILHLPSRLDLPPHMRE